MPTMRETPTPIVDLHCHSTASDGTLSPAQVVRRAHDMGVDLLALTDHDSTNGLEEAANEARRQGLRLIPGIEISSTWQGRLLHIVGLGIDPGHAGLQRGIRGLQQLRDTRAEKIGQHLHRAGFEGAHEAARRLAGEGMVTRTHFARHLVDCGAASDLKQVFKRYLTRGKPGYVSVEWAPMEQVVAWITAAGGSAVLAHPLRYKLTASWLNRVLAAFRDAGGDAMEVVCGNHSVDDTARCALFASKHGLRASAGSDFHEPGRWVELGRLPPLPAGQRAVWSDWT